MPRPKGFLIDGRFLRARRENAGITQDQLATRCQLTRSVVQKAERGGPLAPGTIKSLAQNLGCAESSLIVSEDWKRSVEARVFSPFKPEAAPKIGTIWVQSREMLYQMSPVLLQALALRNLARTLPAYSPRTREGTDHFKRIVESISCSLRVLTVLTGGSGGLPGSAELSARADACYLAAGHTRNANYEDDSHAADAAFAVAIGSARIAESILAARAASASVADANHWRAMELATTACHAAGHASVYLTIEEAFLRAATLDTHDLRNSAKPAAVLAGPLWERGEMPPPLKLFMGRFLREVHFPHETRVLWNGWVRQGFRARPEE